MGSVLVHATPKPFPLINLTLWHSPFRLRPTTQSPPKGGGLGEVEIRLSPPPKGGGENVQARASCEGALAYVRACAGRCARRHTHTRAHTRPLAPALAHTCAPAPLPARARRRARTRVRAHACARRRGVTRDF